MVNPTVDYASMIGEQVGGYTILSIRGETSKSVVFRAFDSELGRNVALKILKSGTTPEREEQFLAEGRKLAKFGEESEHGEHPGIVRVYGAGKERGHRYIVMKLVEGRNLEEIINSGENIPSAKVVRIVRDVSDALSYCWDKGIKHKDIKPANIIESSCGRQVVLDWGSRLTSGGQEDDILGIKTLASRLRDSSKEPKKDRYHERIIKDIIQKPVENPREFIEIIKTHEKVRKRRKFIGSVVAVGTLAIGGGCLIEALDYLDSVNYDVERLKGKGEREEVYSKILDKIFDRKIKAQIEGPSDGKYPYATTDSGNWIKVEQSYWTSGYWPGILWEGYKTTRGGVFRRTAEELSRNMKLLELDNQTINSVRFFHSHVPAFELTAEKHFEDIALRAAETLFGMFRKNGNFLEMVNNEHASINYADTLGTAVPFLCWALKRTENAQFEIAVRGICETTMKLNVREDGSVIQAVEFDPSDMSFVQGVQSHGYSPTSCLARSQARTIEGLVVAGDTLGEKGFLQAAQMCADYFINNLPEDKVPRYDFQDVSETAPKDSASAAIASSALIELSGLTGDRRYVESAFKILGSLCQNYLSIDTRHNGLLLHACADRNRGQHTDSSLIYGDHYFIKSLGKTKN